MKDALKWIAPATRSGGIFEDCADHYVIANGRVTASNRAIAMSAPFEVDWEAYPFITTFKAAVDKAGDAIAFDLNRVGVDVKSKGLRVAVPCLTERPYTPLPSGPQVPLPEGFKAALGTVQPFISTDPARKFICQALVAEGTVVGVNNVGCVQLWTGFDLPAFAIPDFAAKLVMAIKDKPTAVQPGPNDVTFHYEGNRWLKASLYDEQFPWATVQRILERKHDEPTPVPEGLAEAVERLAPFCNPEDQAVYFRDGGIATHRQEGAGAHVEFPGLPKLAWTLKPLQRTLAVATRINWNDPTQQHHFYGDKLRGAVMGRKW